MLSRHSPRGGRPICVMLTPYDPKCIPTRFGRKHRIPLDQDTMIVTSKGARPTPRSLSAR
jgi:hypothetical protein